MLGQTLFNAGIAADYALSSRFSIELRGDFQVRGDSSEMVNPLARVWINADLLWYFNPLGIVQPYLIGGLSMLIVPSDAEAGVSSSVSAGGLLGIGVEVLIGRMLGISVEAIGMLAGSEKQLIAGNVTTNLALTLYL